MAKKTPKHRTAPTSRMLRYVFTNEELQQKGAELADANGAMVALNEDLERIRADFKAKIAAEEAKITSLAGAIRSRYEMRDVACTVTFGLPREGMKTITRDDTKEIVTVEAMTEDEKQSELDFRQDHEKKVIVMPGAKKAPSESAASPAGPQ